MSEKPNICIACDEVIEPRLRGTKDVNLYVMRLETYDEEFQLVQTDVTFHTECWQLGFMQAVVDGYKSLNKSNENITR